MATTRPLVPEDLDRGRPRDALFKALTASFIGKPVCGISSCPAATPH